MSPQLDEATLERLVNDVIHGDRTALARLFDYYRERLWRIVQFRMNKRLVGRVDADDVLQEAYLDAEKRIEHFLYDSPESFFIWLRLIVNQTLIDVHRRHMETQSRDVARERPNSRGWSPESTSFSLSQHLLGEMTTPSQIALKAELTEQLNVALEGMNDLDREVLALRHFEELTNAETARALGISEQAASIRYVRAIGRLRRVLEALPGFRERTQQ
ncbi:MAG TPA: sigma-70 family RNA polymerase sigma factor [Planctomicrobium sp.]|nr:sigma-70 family RNA polymerase sigma factor [Planctomicrobium sp.]